VAIAFDASGGTTSLLQPPTLSWNHTCSGLNRYLFVSMGTTSATAGTISGVTHNGVAMTNLWDKAAPSPSLRSSGWGLINPATGSQTIVATISGVADGFTGVSNSYTGVHQSVPTGTAVTDSLQTGTAASVTVSATPGNLVVDGAAIGNASSGIAAANGQTPRGAQNLVPSGEHDNRTGELAAIASTTIGWTWTGSTDWAIGAIELKSANTPTFLTTGFFYGRRPQIITRRFYKPAHPRIWLP